MKTAVEWLAIELYEKFEMRGDGLLYDDILKQAKEMEKNQQDEFAIGFGEWKDSNITELNYSYINSTKELLEIYKKEKGL